MSGGGGEQKDYFRRGKEEIAVGVEDFLRDDNNFRTFENVNIGDRANFGRELFGANASPDVLRAVETGGFIGITPEMRAATSTFRGLQGGDAFLNQAGNAFSNYRPDALRGVNFGELKNFQSSNLAGQDFGALRAFAPDAMSAVTFKADAQDKYLRQVGSGQFLSPDSNPHLRAAVEASQRPTIEAYREQIAPAMAAQFGGGFGLGGSLQINQQARAARDVTRNLSDSATTAYASAYENERARMDAANTFLSGQSLQRGQLQLNRAQGIDQARLARAQGLGELGLSRASAMDQNALARATELGQLKLQRGSAIENARLQRAEGLAGVGATRGQQAMAAAGALYGIGSDRRAIAREAADIASQQFFARNNKELQKLQIISPLVNTGGAGVGQGSAGRNKLAGAAGGAVSGAAAGSAIYPGVGTVVGGVIGGLGGYFA